MNDDQKLALEQFRNVIGYLQYENTVYWTRSGFLLTAEAALLGFNARVVPTSVSDASWPALGIAFGLCAVALVLCWLGLKMIENSLYWINRWIGLLQSMEPDAFGDKYKIFRDLDTSDGQASTHFARDTAKYLIYVFIVAWLMLLLYLLVVAIAKTGIF